MKWSIIAKMMMKTNLWLTLNILTFNKYYLFWSGWWFDDDPNTIKMHIFLTVGTTQFDTLVQTVLSEKVLKKLKQKGYSSLTLQTGKSKFDKKGFKF
jgi:hypothetical protein